MGDCVSEEPAALPNIRALTLGDSSVSDQITVTFECGNCGASPATLELPDNHTEDDTAKCKACGFEFGRYRDIKAKAMGAARAEVSNQIKGVFKGIKGWKVK